MAKRIFASDEEINDFLLKAEGQLDSFIASIRTTKFQHDKNEELTVKFKLDTPKDDRKAKLFFTPKAWNKMYTLVYAFSSEVEWHGTVERLDESSFLVKDILVFPHEVTGSTVVSNQEEYEEWLNGLDDDTFNALRFHGHSHVNMGVTPSAVDMTYRKNLLNNFEMPNETTDLFYIFIITNKRGEISGEIYDLQNNALYSTDEIEVGTQGGEDDYLSAFLTDAKSMVKEARPVYSGGIYGGSGYGYGYGTGATTPSAPKGTPIAASPQPQLSNKRKKKKGKDQQSQQQTLRAYGVGVGSYCGHEGDDYSDEDEDEWMRRVYGGAL